MLRIGLATTLLLGTAVLAPRPATVQAAGPAPIITGVPASVVSGTEFSINVSNCAGATSASLGQWRPNNFTVTQPFFPIVRPVDGAGNATFTSRGDRPAEPWGLFGRPTFGVHLLQVTCTYGPDSTASTTVSVDLLPPAQLPPSVGSVSVTPRTIAAGRRPTAITLNDAAATSMSLTAPIGVWLYPGPIYVGDALLDPTLPPPTLIPSPNAPLPMMPKVPAGPYTLVLQQASTYASTSIDVGTAFGTMTPARLLETRSGYVSTVDGQNWGEGRRTVGQTTELIVAGRAGVPADAPAAVLNMTVTEPLTDGFITVFPCGAARPNASNVNFVAGQTVANMVIAKVGADGKVCIFNSAPTHLIADVTGWLSAVSGFGSLVPARLLETRAGEASTVDGQSWGAGRVHQVDVTMTGRGGVPTDAAAVALNVTVTDPEVAGFVKVWPCGEAVPNASSLNYAAGQTVANAVIAKVGAGGKVCMLSTAESDLIADVNGWFTAGTSYVPLQPARLVDTRPDGSTIDGKQIGAGAFLRTAPTPPPGVPPLSLTLVGVAGRGGVGVSPSAVVLNVTVTEAQTAGYVSLFPCASGSPPTTSNLNFVAGQTVANAVAVAAGDLGHICTTVSGWAQVVIDVNGWFP